MNIATIFSLILITVGFVVGSFGIYTSFKHINTSLDSKIKLFSKQAKKNMDNYFSNDINPLRHLNLKIGNHKKSS